MNEIILPMFFLLQLTVKARQKVTKQYIEKIIPRCCSLENLNFFLARV